MQILLELRLVSLPLYHARLSILTFDFLDVRASSLHSPMKSKFVDGTRWRRHRKQLMTNKCSCKSKNVLIKPQRFFQSLLAPGTHTVYKLVLQLNPFVSKLDSLGWFACPVSRELQLGLTYAIFVAGFQEKLFKRCLSSIQTLWSELSRFETDSD